jgi:hypothetical protein
MNLTKKFTAAAAALSISAAFSGCAFNAASDRYFMWAALGTGAMAEDMTTYIEGSKRIERWDIPAYDNVDAQTILYIHDVARQEICQNKHKSGDIHGKPTSSSCQPLAKFEEPQIETILYNTCEAATKDRVNARQVLAFCATDHYGRKIVNQPAP